MDVQGLVRSIESSSGGKVVVKVGDQFFEVQSVIDNNDMVCLTLGANFLPREGGGTAPPVSDVTPATGTRARDAQSKAGDDVGDATGNNSLDITDKGKK